MNLATIADMKQKFQIPVGLSDHSMGSLSAEVGTALGANIIEKHFCISREIENPDSSFSMTPEEFKNVTETSLPKITCKMTINWADGKTIAGMNDAKSLEAICFKLTK